MKDEKKCEDKELNQTNELKKLEEEIIKSNLTSEKKKKKLEWNSVIISAILIILTSVAVLQSFESRAILTKIESGNLKSSSNSSALPSSLDNLPNMVGGC